MFEQSSQSYQYQYEPAPEPLKEGDPFYRYEIKNWELGPRIYKILGISALVNILALVTIVQGSLLTMKGCDSPLVGTMCEVLDTVYVGSMLFGTDREYVDVAYDKTDLGDVDITFVDVTGIDEQRLEYPAGYFTIANPEKFTIDPETGQMIAALPPSVTSDIPGIPNGIPFSPPPSTSGNSLFDTTPSYPNANPNPVTGNLPQPGGGVSSPGTRKRGRGGRVNANPNPNPNGTEPTPDPNTVAEAKPSPSPSVEPTEPVDPNAYNSRPLVDLAHQVNDLIAQNKYRLESPFLIAARAKLGKDGKFEKGTFKVNEAQTQFPDAVAKKVLLDAIAAMNDSGRLKILSDISGKDFNLVLMQDGTNLNAVIESEMESEMRANSVKSSFDLAIAVAKQAKSAAGADQNDKDDLQLLQNVVVETSGKKVTIRFVSPKDLFLPMIQRKLDEEKAKAAKPNGTTGIKQTDNTAKK